MHLPPGTHDLHPTRFLIQTEETEVWGTKHSFGDILYTNSIERHSMLRLTSRRSPVSNMSSCSITGRSTTPPPSAQTVQGHQPKRRLIPKSPTKAGLFEPGFLPLCSPEIVIHIPAEHYFHKPTPPLATPQHHPSLFSFGRLRVNNDNTPSIKGPSTTAGLISMP